MGEREEGGEPLRAGERAGEERGRRARVLLGAGLYFLALWLLWDTPVVFPVKILVVFLHEASHGLAAVLTGGEIERLVLTADQGGSCVCGGGDAFLTLSAGYLGSLGWGALILSAGRWPAGRTRTALTLLGAAVLGLTAAYIDAPFGLLFGISFGAALLVAARTLPPPVLRALVTALGIGSVLYALLDIKSDVLDRPQAASDATLLAELTGIPSLAWGVMWSAAALGLCWLLLRREWSRR